EELDEQVDVGRLLAGGLHERGADLVLAVGETRAPHDARAQRQRLGVRVRVEDERQRELDRGAERQRLGGQEAQPPARDGAGGGGGGGGRRGAPRAGLQRAAGGGRAGRVGWGARTSASTSSA